MNTVKVFPKWYHKKAQIMLKYEHMSVMAVMSVEFRLTV